MTPLVPSAALKSTWQLLGYKRYIHRDYFVDRNTLSSIQPKSSQTKMDSLEPVISDLVVTSEQSSTLENSLLQRGEILIADHQSFTLLMRENDALCLPPLWPHIALGKYGLLSQESEWFFLQNVFDIVALPQFQMLLACREMTFNAPRLQGKVSALKKWQAEKLRYIVMMGDTEYLRTELAQVMNVENVIFLPCTHPAIAICSGATKRRFWLDLLNILLILNEKKIL